MKTMRARRLLLAVPAALLACFLAAGAARAADRDEFKVKREAVFKFAEKPSATRNGDRVTISFATQGYCDATVAIEDAGGRILRHLACGVLGKNAPPPFKKGSKKQVLIWDGKDDLGRYVDDKDNVVVRVSLGLRARFERSLFWSAGKRWSSRAPLISAAPEGVYVFDYGGGVSQLRLYSHEGSYLRTVYPFPAEALGSHKQLEWLSFPQDGRRLPRKRGHRQCTLLTSGTDSDFFKTMGGGKKHSMPDPAKALAVRGGRVALAYVFLNRFATDGAALPERLKGGRSGVRLKRSGLSWRGGNDLIDAGPTAMCFSPDGKTLYTTAYSWTQHWGTGGIHTGWLNGVGRISFEGDAKLETFAGNVSGEDKGGTAPGKFRVPTSVACDSKGRVYVADNLNDRVQIFSVSGKFLKAVKVPRPAKVVVHHKTGKILVLSWLVRAKAVTYRRRDRGKGLEVPPRLYVFGSFENPAQEAVYKLPRGLGAASHVAEIDTYARSLTVWLTPLPTRRRRPEAAGTRLLVLEKGELVEKRDFGKLVVREILRASAPTYLRQKLYVNPKTGKLYLAEGDAGVGKSTGQLLEIDPDSGRVRKVELPFDAEDLCFDLQGFIYLRARQDIARFDPTSWREIPWDYGEERKSVGFGSSAAEGAGMRRKNVISSLRIPSRRYNHHGGMMVSARGHLVVGIHGGQEPATDRKGAKKVSAEEKYSFRLYPGRNTSGLVLIYDRYGRVVYDDALPGISFQHGVGIDKDDNIYVMAMAHRVMDGKPYHNEATDTLMKVKPGKSRVLSTRAKIKLKTPPKRPPDIIGKGGARLGSAWVEKAEWFYGGVGYHGRHSKTDGYGCDCSNSRFALDYFARSFAPEVEHCSVAVLDSAGNLILRVGTYGNADDGKPLVAAGGPPKTRPLGGDEVGLFYAPYVATHTDRRLFIADPGNHRIVAVRLDYHAVGKVQLKNVPDRPKGR